MTNNHHLIDSARSQVNKMLPKKYRNCFREPVINFLLYDYDANGNSNGINMDLLVFYDMENFKPGLFFGHEMLRKYTAR